MYFLTFYAVLAVTGSAALLGFAAEAVSRFHGESDGRRPSQTPPGGLRPSLHP